MKKLLALVILFCALASAAESKKQTVLSGELNGFLNAEDSPYLVSENIFVSESGALVLEAGVEIYFKPNTGLEIRGGAFVVNGSESTPVLLSSLDSNEQWTGVSITGEKLVSLNNLDIRNAKIGIAIENANMDLRNSNLSNSSVGLFVKNAVANLQNVTVKKNSDAGIIASANGFITLSNSDLQENRTALAAGEMSNIKLISTNVSNNEYGLLDMGNNVLQGIGAKIEKNKTGIIATDIPVDEWQSVSDKNEVNIAQGALELYKTMPEEPENVYVQDAVKKYDLEESVEKKWSLSGTVASTVGYHLVRMRHNRTGEDYIVFGDTVKPDASYNNYFQRPGLFAAYNLYMVMQSPNGETFEFNADLESDHWNNFYASNINLTYSDEARKIALGDIYVNGGESFLAGINLLGVSYDLHLFKISSGQPMFELSVFGGEAKPTKLVGERNSLIYKDWIDDGEAQAQEIVVGGKIKWNMHRRFNGALGFIGSRDFIHDPFFRDGLGTSQNTLDPQITSKTFFAEGNWQFWPGDIDLNGQVAFGGADTADVHKQRAINEVFSSAGLSVSNFALLRKLMNDETKVASLSQAELLEIFGETSVMTPSQMRNELKKLLEKAKSVAKNYKDNSDAQDNITEWDGQNLAVAANLRWVVNKTVINAHLSQIGSKYYSAGSPDQLSNYREIGGTIDQKLFNFWKLSLGYTLTVENASIGNKYNVFALNEGTAWGLFNESGKQWKKEHELDDERALYIHDASFGNEVKLGMFTFDAKYKMDYRHRHRPTRLYADYSAASGVFKDDFFAPKKDSQTYTFVTGDDSVVVDSASFMKYYGLSEEKFLASDFEERFLRNSIEASVKAQISKNIVKVGGIWSFRTDMSEFANDSIVSRFDFSDKTQGYLGYYFHGSDYFEQRYPISVTSNYDAFHNQLTITPRFKKYNRDNMKEKELSISESMEFPIIHNFLDFSLNGEYRLEYITSDAGIDETEADIDGNMSFRVHYTKNLYSDYTLGSYYNYRPDSRADDYNDFYGSFSLNYSF